MRNHVSPTMLFCDPTRSGCKTWGGTLQDEQLVGCKDVGLWLLWFLCIRKQVGGCQHKDSILHSRLVISYDMGLTSSWPKHLKFSTKEPWICFLVWKNKSASFGFKHLEKLWTKFFVVIPFRPSMEKATALIKALPSSKVGKYVGRCCWKFHDRPDVPEIIEWSILGRKQYKHNCFFFGISFGLVCALVIAKKYRWNFPAFHCVFSGWKSRTKEPNSWSSIEHFSVFVAIGVWDRCLRGRTPCGFQRFSNGWDRGTSRCMTLLMPHVPQQLQQRCRGNDSNQVGLRWKCCRKFRGDWKNITLSVGLTWWLIMVDTQLLFLGVFGGQHHKASSSKSFLLFCPWNSHGMHWKAVWRWDNPTILTGRKQMLVCSAAWKVHASRGARWFWWLVGVWWDLFSTLGFWLGVLWFVFAAPELGGAHRPTGRLWPAGCGSARQSKPSVTTGGANSWR